MCSVYSTDVRRRGCFAPEFTLCEFINMDCELVWFPPKVATWGGRQTDVAGFAHENSDGSENRLHPSVMIKDRGDRMRFQGAVWLLCSKSSTSQNPDSCTTSIKAS